MDLILADMYEARRKKWEKARDFLEAHTGSDGKISAKDAQNYEILEAEILNMDKKIEDRLRQPTSEPIYSYPQKDPFANNNETRAHRGVAGGEYKRRFFNEFRNGFQTAVNSLQESTLAQGGYLVPTEFHDKIISAVTEGNVLRKIGSTVIRTAAPRKISVLASKPTAYWVTEGASITLSSPTFAQKTLDAYKLAVGLTISNELLQDSYFDLETFAAQEFGKALAAAEEEAFLTGNADDRPNGLLTVLAADSDMTITATGNTIAADDIIDLIHSVKTPYRRNAAFLMNDSTLAIVRKLKDNTQNYLWQPNFAAGEPERILGFPVYTTRCMTSASSGNICILFGDFSAYFIGDRSEMAFKALRELHALTDQSTFLAIERVDAILTDTSAIRGLKLK